MRDAWVMWLRRLARAEVAVRRLARLAYWRWQAWCIRATIRAHERDMAHALQMEQALPQMRRNLLNARVEREDELREVLGRIDGLLSGPHPHPNPPLEGEGIVGVPPLGGQGDVWGRP